MLEMEPLPSYIVGSHPMLGRELCTGLLEPTSPSNEELPRRRLEAVGPMGRSASLPLGPPTFSLLLWAVLRAHWSMVYGLASSLLDFFSGGLLVHVWRHLIGRCLLLGTKGVISLHFQLNHALIEI